MARTPSSRRPSKRQGEPDDAFVATVFEASSWAKQNQATLVVLGIVVAVLVLAGTWYLDRRADLNQRAIVELEQIQTELQVGDPEVARENLDRFLERFADTKHAPEARLLLATVHLQADRPQDAIDVLEASEVSRRRPIAIQIRTLLAKSYESAGQLERAEEVFLAVADAAELDFQIRNALESAARLKAVRGDHAGAAELYQRIIDGLEDTDPRVGVYQMRLQEALTRAN